VTDKKVKTLYGSDCCRAKITSHPISREPEAEFYYRCSKCERLCGLIPVMEEKSITNEE